MWGGLDNVRDKRLWGNRFCGNIESSFQPCPRAFRLSTVGGVDARQYATCPNGFAGFGEGIHSYVVVDARFLGEAATTQVADYLADNACVTSRDET